MILWFYENSDSLEASWVTKRQDRHKCSCEPHPQMCQLCQQLMNLVPRWISISWKPINAHHIIGSRLVKEVAWIPAFLPSLSCSALSAKGMFCRRQGAPLPPSPCFGKRRKARAAQLSQQRPPPTGTVPVVGGKNVCRRGSGRLWKRAGAERKCKEQM